MLYANKKWLIKNLNFDAVNLPKIKYYLATVADKNYEIFLQKSEHLKKVYNSCFFINRKVQLIFVGLKVRT